MLLLTFSTPPWPERYDLVSPCQRIRTSWTAEGALHHVHERTCTWVKAENVVFFTLKKIDENLQYHDPSLRITTVFAQSQSFGWIEVTVHEKQKLKLDAVARTL